MVEKYSQLSNYFKEYKVEDAEKAMTETRFKKFADAFEVKDKAPENLKAICEQWDIDFRLAFQFIEYVVVDNFQLLLKLSKTVYSDELQAMFNEQIIPLITQEQIEVYQAVSALISMRTYENLPIKHKLNEFVETLCQKGLLTNLWKQYKSLWKQTAPKMYKSNPGLFYFEKIRKQFWILLVIFKGMTTGVFQVDEVLYLDMYNTFADQRFKGSYSADFTYLADIEVDPEYEQNVESIRHLSCLVLIAGLGLNDLLRLDPSELLSERNRTFRVITKTGEPIVKSIQQMCVDNDEDYYKIGHYASAVQTAIDTLGLLIDRFKKSELREVRAKLNQVLRGADFDMEYTKGVEDLLSSNLYSYLAPTERILLKKVLKDFLAMVFIPKRADNNNIESIPEEDLLFISKTLCQIISSPEELEEFWSSFNQEDLYRNDISVIFSNFLDIFPFRGEQTIKIASNLVGRGGYSYVRKLIDIFANLTKYTHPEGDISVRYGSDNSVTVDDSGSTRLVLEEAFAPNNLGGLIIPAKTRFYLTETNRAKFSFRYNYWHVFWRQITGLLNESKSKDISLNMMHQKVLKLVCRVLKQDPQVAPYLQLLMLTPDVHAAQADLTLRDDVTQGYGALALLLLEILNLNRVQTHFTSIALEIVSAINSLLTSSISNEMIVAIQMYPHIAMTADNRTDSHVLAAAIDLLGERQYLPNKQEKQARLVEEAVKLVELILYKSDYLYDYFPVEQFVQIKNKLKNTEELTAVKAIQSGYADLFNCQFWIDDATRVFNEQVVRVARSLRPGAMGIPTTLIYELLHKTLIQALDVAANNATVDFATCTDIRFSILARIFSIITNLLQRFKSTNGCKLVSQRMNLSGSISLEDISEFLNKLELTRYLFTAIDVEISKHEVFFGSKDSTVEDNAFGIENKSYATNVVFSPNIGRTASAFQTYMIEALRCFNEACGLVEDYLRDGSGPASRLLLVRELTAAISTSDSFYSNLFNTFPEEYSINFFVMLLMLTNFNTEKGLKTFEDLGLHQFDYAIESMVNPALFASNSTYDFQRMFSFKINQSLALGTGRTGEILRDNSVSTAALHTLQVVLRLWRKAGRASKPVLVDVLTTGKISPHFTSNVLPWMHQRLLDRMRGIETDSIGALQALKLLGECVVSQPAYFSDFLKYCSNIRDAKVNDLIQTMKEMIEYLESVSIGELFERDALFECLCQIIQLTSNLYLRPSVRREVVSQIRSYLLAKLTDLIARALDQRKSLIGTAIDCAVNMFLVNGSFNIFEQTNLQSTIDLLRIRYLMEQESSFCFSLSQFSQVLNAELLERTKTVQAVTKESTLAVLNTRFFLKVANYCLERKRLSIPPFLEKVEKILKTRLLIQDTLDQSAVGLIYHPLADVDNEIHFRDLTNFVEKPHREGFFDETWGKYFDEQDAQLKLRESNVQFDYASSALLYISIYNILNNTGLHSKRLLEEVNKNVAFVTGNGLNGALFSANLHQNPAISAITFTKNIYKMLIENGLSADVNELEFRYDELIRGASEINEAVSKEINIDNPFFDGKMPEWLGTLYNFTGKFVDDFTTYKFLVDAVLQEISQLVDAIRDAKKEFGIGRHDIFTDKTLLELVASICQIATSHLVTLGHIVTNMYFGLTIKRADEVNENRELTKKTIQIITSYIAVLNGHAGYLNDTTANESILFEQILLSNYYALFVLSQFAEDVTACSLASSYQGVAQLLRQGIRPISDRLPIMIQSYSLLMRFYPEIFEAADLDVFLKHIQDERLDAASFKSICQLLLVAFDHPRLRQVACSGKTITAFSQTRRFLGQAAFHQFIYYKNAHRDPEASLWMWTLAVVVHAFDPMKRFGGALEGILAFVKTYQARILSVIGWQFVAMNSQFGNVADSPFGLIDDRVRSETFRSVAYLEELELTTTLIDLLFGECSKWVSQHKMTFDNIIYLLLTRTLGLFDASRSLSEQYVPISWLEKISHTIKANPTSDAHAPEQLSRKASVLPKATNKKSSYLSDANRTRFEPLDLTTNYKPDLFSLEIEVRLLKIMFHVASAVSEGINYVDLVSGGAPGLAPTYMNQVLNGQGQPTMVFTTPGTIKYRYDEAFWRRIPEHLVNLQRYLRSSLFQFVGNDDTYKKSMVRLAMFNNSAETTLQSEMINSIFPIVTTRELHRMAFASMEMFYYVAIMLFMSHGSIERNTQLQTLDLMKRARQESAAILSEFDRINRQKMVLNPSASVMNKGSLHTGGLSTVRRMDEEDNDERYFMNFVKRYFPMNA